MVHSDLNTLFSLDRSIAEEIKSTEAYGRLFDDIFRQLEANGRQLDDIRRQSEANGRKIKELLDIFKHRNGE